MFGPLAGISFVLLLIALAVFLGALVVRLVLLPVLLRLAITTAGTSLAGWRRSRQRPDSPAELAMEFSKPRRFTKPATALNR